MMLVTTGKLDKQVASDLGLSEITVKIHRAAAMRKKGARTLTDPVRMADMHLPLGHRGAWRAGASHGGARFYFTLPAA
jgi:hypothetical protein